MIKTYRGQLADGAQEKIPLATKDGSVGYRIVKFEIIGVRPSTTTQESTVKIYTRFQSSITDTIDLTEADLLGVAYRAGPAIRPIAVIFDREIFNQDIYVTHVDDQSAGGYNYYIELEQMKLDHTQNMSATLKAIRGLAVD